MLARGAKVSGCTVHFSDNIYDNGPIILQRAVPVLDDDTPQTLAARVFEAECEAYPEAIRLYAAGRLEVDGRRVRILPCARSNQFAGIVVASTVMPPRLSRVGSRPRTSRSLVFANVASIPRLCKYGMGGNDGISITIAHKMRVNSDCLCLNLIALDAIIERRLCDLEWISRICYWTNDGIEYCKPLKILALRLCNTWWSRPESANPRFDGIWSILIDPVISAGRVVELRISEIR